MSKVKQLWFLFIAFTLVTVLAPFVFVINTIKFWNSNYWFQVAIGLDQLGGSILYNEEDYTVSSYTFMKCHYYKRMCWFMKFIDFLFGKSHCQRSFTHEQNKIRKEAQEWTNKS